MSGRAVFLDRDGTINHDGGYLYRKEDFSFIEGSIEAIRLLNQRQYKVLVVTNQSGVARGYYGVEDVIRLHSWINEKLKEHKAHIDKFYFCPHHIEGRIEGFRAECNCRKPETGLIEEAIKEFNIDVENSYLVGDKETDVLAGNKAGLKSILVLTGCGKTQNTGSADFIERNLYFAVNNIILRKGE